MPADESDALAEVARLRRELHAKDAADAASAAILAEKTLRIRELEQEVKHLDDELRSAPATPPRPPPAGRASSSRAASFVPPEPKPTVARLPPLAPPSA